MTFWTGLITGILGTLAVAWLSISVWATAFVVWGLIEPEKFHPVRNPKGVR